MAYVNMAMDSWGGCHGGKGGKSSSKRGKSWDTQHGGSEKEQFVDQVKSWQRKGEAHKTAWYNFCGEQGTSNYDPNRHEVESLQLFMSGVELGTIQPDESGGSKSWSSGGDTEKDPLVSKVKAYQRQGENHKMQWYDYVQSKGSQNYDPNRHDASVLLDFLQNAEAGQLPMPSGKSGGGGGAGKGGGGGSHMNWQSGGGGSGWGGSDWAGSGGGADNSQGGAGGKPGDWVCPSCQNVNFSKRKECNKCGASSEGATRIGLKPGDWICPNCGDLVFASKSACKLCGTPKPEGAGEKGDKGGKAGGKGKKGGGGCGMGGFGMGGCGMDMAAMMNMMGMNPMMASMMDGGMMNPMMASMMDGGMGNWGGGGGRRSSPY